jgi:hypothetical protein
MGDIEKLGFEEFKAWAEEEDVPVDDRAYFWRMWQRAYKSALRDVNEILEKRGGTNESRKRTVRSNSRV